MIKKWYHYYNTGPVKGIQLLVFKTRTVLDFGFYSIRYTNGFMFSSVTLDSDTGLGFYFEVLGKAVFITVGESKLSPDWREYD